MTEPAAVPDAESAPPELYDAAYFAHHCGATYERNDHWIHFFGDTADRIVGDISPRTVLDAGCAMGFLVESLRDRGVEAFGIDISEFAISQVREDVRKHCAVHSILEPLPRDRYDLITCIEVAEHLEAKDAAATIANLCQHTDDILFTSSPEDFTEATHVNVQPPEYWSELFAANGFFRDITYDASYLVSWAVRYRRARDPVPRVIAEYDRAFWHQRQESLARNRVIVEQMQTINDLTAKLEGAGAAAEAQVDSVRRELEASRRELEASGRELESRGVERGDLERELRATQLSLLEAGASLARLESEAGELRVLRESASLKAAQSVRRGLHRVLPGETLRGRLARRTVRAGRILRHEGPGGIVNRVRHRRRPIVPIARPDAPAVDQYREWLGRTAPTLSDLARMRVEQAKWGERPLISVLLPTYNTEISWLDDAVGSVLGQTYTHWELCISDDGSVSPELLRALEQYQAGDSRIKVVYRQENGGIVANSQSALDMAEGDFVAFLDHDDVLAPHALHAVVSRWRADASADIVYSDEDKILPSGERGEPFFKPDWSPDLLLAWNYITHFVVMRRSLIEAAGGFQPGEGAQDHDLLLRASELARSIVHVPDVLYSWRMVPGSVALSSESKPHAFQHGIRAVEAALSRRGRPGRVSPGAFPGAYTVRYSIQDQPTVDIVIPTRDRLELLRACIQSVEQQSTYTNVRIIIVDNGTVEPAASEYLAATAHTVVRRPMPFNFSALINAGVARSSADHVILLNNDTTVVTPDWIEAMLEHSQRPEVGAVGVRLLQLDGSVQHEGIGLGRGFIAANLNMGWPVIRDAAAVTAACMMIRRDVFNEVGGFDEHIAVAFNDVDFCLRLRRAGYQIVYTPHAELRHAEGCSRGAGYPPSDAECFQERWGPAAELVDPYLSPHVETMQPLTLRLP